MEFPRISFGMIVLNGEPFVRYNLRALYPFAHEIIVVEGAVPAARNAATPDGHSRDSTLQTLLDFKNNEDPDGKLIIVKLDGFWAEKDEMSQAYAARATGDYLWQIDCDEFYLPEHMQAVIDMLRSRPEITAISFKMITFWGSPSFITDGWYLRRGADIYHRVFKWGSGYTYETHRPPTILDPIGRDMRHLHWLNGERTGAYGWMLYHYSLLLPKQVIEKSDYYTHADWERMAGFNRWAERGFVQLRDPFHVHNIYTHPSWLERFEGKHPPQIEAMWQDIMTGEFDFDVRPMEDVNRLLNSWWYPPLTWLVRHLDAVNVAYHGRRLIRRIRAKLRLIWRSMYNRKEPDAHPTCQHTR
jgi:hypothetical protein